MALCAALAVHAGLAIGLAPGGRPGAPAPGLVPVSLPVQLRVVSVDPVAVAAVDPAAADGPAEVPTVSAVADTTLAAPGAAQRAPSLPPAPDPAPAPRPPARADLPMVDGYVLRQALTRAPMPLAEVVPPWPAGLAPNDVQAGRFTLFISEAGRVDRIEPDGPSLFPALEDSAREAFSAARFQPGEVDGRVVKSVIRIEVVFDPRPAQVPGAVVVSRQNL